MPTKEKQYKLLIDIKKKFGVTKLGLMSNANWIDDPSRLAFCTSRYKFVAKMLSGKKEVLEVGSSDGFYSRIVNQHVKNLTIVDFDVLFIEDFKKYDVGKGKIKSFVHDIVKQPMKKKYDATYSLDVLEHINPKDEKKFIVNSIKSMKKNGIFICGMPSLESQKYASKESKLGHVNCKSGEQLRNTLNKYFFNTFIFSMNDEVVHTGYFPMSHYLFGIGCNPKKYFK